MKKYFEQRFCEALDSDWPIVVAGNEYQSSEVLKVYAPHDYESYFTDWLEQQKTEAKQRVKEYLLANGCLQRFNRLAERTIEEQVLPFVGAGMSQAKWLCVVECVLEGIGKGRLGACAENR